MRILTLDDMESRQQVFRRWFAGFTHDEAFDAALAKNLLDNFDYDLVMLDHDLAEEHYLTLSEGLSENWQPELGEVYSPGTGMEVVDHIIAMPAEKRPKLVIIHSWNIGRADEMWQRLYQAGVPVQLRRFSPSQPVVL